MCWDAAFPQKQPYSCIMLQATIKLCCGIAHDPLRHLPGKHCLASLQPQERQAEKRFLKEILSLHLMGIPLGLTSSNMVTSMHLFFLPHCITHRVVLVLAPHELPAETWSTTASSLYAPCSPKPTNLSLGLKTTAIAAIQKDTTGLMVRGYHYLSSRIPSYIQRLMGKETGKLRLGAWINFLALLTTSLQHMMEGCVLKCTPLHLN